MDPGMVNERHRGDRETWGINDTMLINDTTKIADKTQINDSADTGFSQSIDAS